jgi:hypothetical protein
MQQKSTTPDKNQRGPPHAAGFPIVSLDTAAVYQRALRLLMDGGVQFLLGGAYALAHYAGVVRPTKDLDLFVMPQDSERVLQVLAAGGFRVELTFPHWLGKAFSGDDFIDVIFSSGNAMAPVDREWFDHAVEVLVLDMPVRLCPAEETIWSKAWVMERERYDGADVAHLLRACAERLDWSRLLRRFDGNWRVLLSHVVLFGFIYPSERHKVPEWVIGELTSRLHAEATDDAKADHLCRGTLLSREQYLIDVEHWHYADARVTPLGNMSREDTDRWTAAIWD